LRMSCLKLRRKYGPKGTVHRMRKYGRRLSFVPLFLLRIRARWHKPVSREGE
jgi:hypothetical protein